MKGKPEGYGQIFIKTTSSFASYVGMFKNGLPNGEGIYSGSSYDIYYKPKIIYLIGGATSLAKDNYPSIKTCE